MFGKVLVAEDLGSTNHGIVVNLKKQLDIAIVKQALYCDEAVLQMLKSKKDEDPYDLLITDLSFTQDHRPQKISSGQELIIAVRAIFPDIKILVFSIENRPNIVQPLFTDYGINGYICKGRDGLKELKKAVIQIYSGINYLSQELERSFKTSTVFEFQDFDILLLQHLAEGYSQDDISIKFKKEALTPSSISGVEKRINKLKIQFRAKNTTQLIAITKDLGLI